MESPYTLGVSITPSDTNTIPTTKALILNGASATANVAVGFSGIKPAKAIAVVNASGGIASVTVTDPGFGYTNAPTVTVQGALGSGATFTATVANGKVTGITVNTAGSDYINPEIKITTNNTQSVVLTLVTGEIYNLAVNKIFATGTTATGIIALY